jgi:hypothetical protein
MSGKDLQFAGSAMAASEPQSGNEPELVGHA